MRGVVGEEKRTIFVYVNYVSSTTDGRAITASAVVVATVELIQDQGCTISADILDQSELGIGDEVASWITRV